MSSEEVTKNNIVALLQSLEPRMVLRRQLLGELGENPGAFNLFKVVSDKYRKENLHSDILAYLLDKAPGFLDLFLEHVDKLKNLEGNVGISLKSQFDTRYRPVVLREKGRIDILIHNDKQAIILENKLNGAPDMDTQLCRYYHYAVKRSKEVLAIIYIPLGKEEEPPIKNYSCAVCAAQANCNGRNHFKFEVLRPLTKTLQLKPLVELLSQWGKFAEQEDMKMFIRHYENLLREIGASSMTKQNDISVVEAIFSDENSLQTAIALCDIWQKKQIYLRELVDEKLTEKLLNRGYATAEDIFWEKGGNFLVKNLANNSYFKRVIYKPKWLTFALEPLNGEKAKVVADGILEQFDDCYLAGVRTPEGKAFFCHRNFYFDNPTQTLDKIVDTCVKCFVRLEELAQAYQDK